MGTSDVFGILGTVQAGNFHVERVVAEGGFGVVYRAQHGAFRAPVALKCLKIPEQMTKQQRAVFLEKFREEAELMFRLSAAITEVVRPLHVDILSLPDGRFVPFLALEWLEGESLDGIITRRREQGQAPLGLHKVVKMLRPVASALSRAHRFPGPQGAVSIIHRDLKPENIFVASIGGSESMKILDFGIAKAKRAASQAVGRITGRSIEEDESASFTPAYGSPEQWSPKTYGETGPWTDVWGLALTLVESLCGAPPIDGDTYVMRRVCLDDKRRPTPRNMGADVPIEVERVFERALSVDPRRRFKDIEGFWSELEIAMGMEPSLRTRDPRREPGETPAASALGPGLTDSGKALAKLDLLKIPSIAAMPAVRVQGEAAPVPMGGDPPYPPARPVPMGGDPPYPPARPIPKPPAAPPKPRAPLPSEDWSSLGLGDAPAKKPPAQRPAVGAEMPLPSRASLLDLEMALPTRADSVPPPASSRESAPPSSRRDVGPRSMQRSFSNELEMALPTHDEPPPPAMAEPQRRSLVDLEAAIPTREAAPEPIRSPDYEPTSDWRKLPASRDAPRGNTRPADDALDFEIHVEPAKKPSLRPAALVALSPDSARAANRASGMAADVPPRSVGLVTREPEPPPAGLRERLTAPLAILLGALAIALVSFAFQKVTGNPLELGPVRLTWIAGPLGLFGVGFLLFRLIGVHEDE